MHVLDTLHEIPTVPWWILQLLNTLEFAILVISKALLFLLTELVHAQVIVHKNTLLKVSVLWPFVEGSIDDVLEMHNPFFRGHPFCLLRSVGTPLLYLEGDAEIRRRGRNPNPIKQAIIAEVVELKCYVVAPDNSTHGRIVLPCLE
jgi:hypothetical protein